MSLFGRLLSKLKKNTQSKLLIGVKYLPKDNTTNCVSDYRFAFAKIPQFVFYLLIEFVDPALADTPRYGTAEYIIAVSGLAPKV